MLHRNSGKVACRKSSAPQYENVLGALRGERARGAGGRRRTPAPERRQRRERSPSRRPATRDRPARLARQIGVVATCGERSLSSARSIFVRFALLLRQKSASTSTDPRFHRRSSIRAIIRSRRDRAASHTVDGSGRGASSLRSVDGAKREIEPFPHAGCVVHHLSTRRQCPIVRTDMSSDSATNCYVFRTDQSGRSARHRNRWGRGVACLRARAARRLDARHPSSTGIRTTSARRPILGGNRKREVWMKEGESERLEQRSPSSARAAFPAEVRAKSTSSTEARRSRSRGSTLMPRGARATPRDVAYYADRRVFSGDCSSPLGWAVEIPAANWDTLSAFRPHARRNACRRDSRPSRHRPGDNHRDGARAQPVPRMSPPRGMSEKLQAPRGTHDALQADRL